MTAGDINIYYARIFSDEQITYIVEFSEKMDIQRLKDSLKVLNDVLPILSTRLVKKNSRLYRVNAETVDWVIELIETDRGPQEAVLQFVAKPCDPLSEIPLKIRVIREVDRDTLCIKVDHVLSDAAGLKYLLYLLAEAYTSGKIVLPPNPRRGLGQVFRRIPPLKFLRAMKDARFPRPGPPLIQGPFASTPPFIERVVIPPDRFVLMKQKAFRDGATINDILLTAVYRVIFANENVKEGMAYPVMVPVDLRRYLPEKLRCCISNLAIGIYPVLEKISQESFMDTLGRVKNSMDDYKQHTPGIGSVLLISLACLDGGKRMEQEFRLAAAHSPGSIILSNFGMIDHSKVRFDRLSIEHVYAVGPIQAPGMLIAVNSYRDALTLVVQGTDDRVQCFIHDFLKSIIAEVELYIQALPNNPKASNGHNIYQTQPL